MLSLTRCALQLDVWPEPAPAPRPPCGEVEGGGGEGGGCGDSAPRCGSRWGDREAVAGLHELLTLFDREVVLRGARAGPAEPAAVPHTVMPQAANSPVCESLARVGPIAAAGR